jgi:hypothetical protein
MPRAVDIFCAIVGHDRRYRQTQYIRHGRWHNGSRCSCIRCGTQDSATLHRSGTLEYVANWRYHLGEILHPLRAWFSEGCVDCGKPCRRLGRKVGDHHDCTPSDAASDRRAGSAVHLPPPGNPTTFLEVYMDALNTTQTNLQKLPGICAASHPITGAPILISAGESGYYPLPPHFDVEAFNKRNGITCAEVDAMVIGSMFGWNSPGANPSIN